jgi:hypothetical protein
MAVSRQVHEVNVEKALAEVRSLITSAEGSIEALARDEYGGGDEWMLSHYASVDVGTAFTQLLVLADALGLMQTYEQIGKAYKETSEQEHGLSATVSDPNCDVHLLAAAPLRRFVASLSGVFGLQTSHIVSKNVVDILRATQYAITDRNCFANPPSSEADVHHRVEAVLKCMFPDLRHMPPLAKSIKNFKPDTGLPSMRTLVEYKFIQVKGDVERVADEILADTRGYTSGDWDSFIFLIYETCRLKPEGDWNDLLRECGTALNTQVLVICGESPPPSTTKKKHQVRAKKQKP